MTTGSNTKDYRISIPGTTGLYGLVNNTSWIGTDRPKLPKRPPMVENRPVTMHVWHHGKRIQVVRLKRFRVPQSPPKRSRESVTPHPFSKSWSQRHSGQFQLLDGRSFTTDGAGYFLTGAADALSNENEFKLIGRLRTKVAGSSFNAGVFLGELKESLGTIRQASERIALALAAVSGGQLKLAARALTAGTTQYHLVPKKIKASRDISDNWLQLQYGWLPLLGDVHDAAEFLAHQLNVGLQQRVTVSVTQYTGSFTNSSPGNILGPLDESTRVFYTRKSIIALLKEVDVPQLSGLLDPLSVAWELTPYSLVADWFIPIGNWLSARGLQQSLSGTFVISEKRSATIQGLRLNSANHASNPQDYWHRFGSFNRTVSYSLPIPTPHLVPLSEAFSWKRAANAVALLTKPLATGRLPIWAPS